MLPDYCYHILELWRRTLFADYHVMGEVVQGSAPTRRAAGDSDTVTVPQDIVGLNWQKLSSTVAPGYHCFKRMVMTSEQDVATGGVRAA